MQDEPTIPEGLCQCGCGRPTKRIAKTQSDRGYRAGDHFRYCVGHANRININDCYSIDSDTGCWVWNLQPDSDGYAKITHNGRWMGAHRVMYEQVHGEIPEGLVIDHKCRNRKCVNPDHLEAVTNAMNIQRGSRTKLSPDQVREIRSLQPPYRWTEIGRRYGVTATAIRYVIKGWSWQEMKSSSEAEA